MPTNKPFNWAQYKRSCGWCVDETKDDWFKAPYRSREEALRVAFGPHWQPTDVPVRADFVLPGLLLTHPGSGFRIFTHFFAENWHPVENDPQRLAPGQRPPSSRGRVRDLRSTLRHVVDTSIGAPSLSALARIYGQRAVDNSNPQAYAYPPALVEVWLSEQNITGFEAEGLRVLAGLGGPSMAADLIAETEPLTPVTLTPVT